MLVVPYNWATLLANVLILAAVFVFSFGFFPYKPLLPGLSEFDEVDRNAVPPPVFDKVIFMVVDALRSDFVFSNESKFLFTQSLIRSGAALPFTAHASAPTVTMPRLKAITTGSVPSFLDLILNIAESDTTSTLTYQDTWLAQLKRRGSRLVMYGDDTWLRLFPGMFDRADGTTSFFVSDFTEVDNNVTRHVSDELSRSDWSAFIMHYLGLDHIGHKIGPRGSYMAAKQREMDSVVNEIYTALEREPHLQSTLLVLCGDHGMNDAGNHGGSSPGETSPALLFASPKFQGRGIHRDSPVSETDTMQYYRTVEQADITPTLSGLLGMPIPLNSLGTFIPELLTMWDYGPHRSHILLQNSKQLLKIVQAKFPGYSFESEAVVRDCDSGTKSDVEGIQCAWLRILQLTELENAADFSPEVEAVFLYFLKSAQSVMSSASSSYDVTRLYFGLLVCWIAMLVVLPSTYKLTSRFWHAGTFLLFSEIGYGVIMFASSYVEEEQQFWYWTATGWILYLHIRRSRSDAGYRFLAFSISDARIVGLAVTHRILRRWNQTGQKFTTESDIARGFLSSHPNMLWFLIALSYIDICWHLFASMPASVVWRLVTTATTVAAFIFKLNFVSADSPELLIASPLDLAAADSISLVTQARLVFCGIVLLAVLPALFDRNADKKMSYHGVLHEAVALTLVTQSKATNIPLFLVLRMQLCILDSIGMTSVEMTITSLISQYTAFFAFGGSNSISSIDLSSAYNGVGRYNTALVGILVYISNWAGPIWWASAMRLLKNRPSGAERLEHITLLTFHVTINVLSVMAACTVLRSHLFIWSVFSPKYLYTVVWAVINYMGINMLSEMGFLLM